MFLLSVPDIVTKSYSPNNMYAPRRFPCGVHGILLSTLSWTSGSLPLREHRPFVVALGLRLFLFPTGCYAQRQRNQPQQANHEQNPFCETSSHEITPSRR